MQRDQSLGIRYCTTSVYIMYIEYTNKDLANNWYEFNDSVITPINVGRLQKVFKSKTSAYMLFYIKVV